MKVKFDEYKCRKICLPIVIVGLILVGAGCATKSKMDVTTTINSVDANGQPVQTVVNQKSSEAENVAFSKSLGPIMEKCISDISKEDAAREEKSIAEVADIPENCSAFSSASGQTACIATKEHLATVAILGIAIESLANQGPNRQMSPQEYCGASIAKIAQGYHDKEGKQADAWKAAGITGLIALPTAWVFSRGIDMVNDMAAGQGDQISTGNINVTKSDDPIGGEGGGASGSIGGQSINIGSGASASDQGQALGAGTVIDKNQATTFKDAESNLDGSGNPSGVVLDDRNDGSDNEFGL